MPDLDLHLDPFTRTHVGTHNAFLLRINREHARIAIAAASWRRDQDERGVEPATAPVKLVRRAA